MLDPREQAGCCLRYSVGRVDQCAEFGIGEFGERRLDGNQLGGHTMPSIDASSTLCDRQPVSTAFTTGIYVCIASIGNMLLINEYDPSAQIMLTVLRLDRERRSTVLGPIPIRLIQ